MIAPPISTTGTLQLAPYAIRCVMERIANVVCTNPMPFGSAEAES